MQPFKNFTGIVIPLDRANVDTDAIIPKQYLKAITRTGFGQNLFDEWRYLDPGEPGDDHSKRRLNPDFVLNQDRYRQGQILLARENFGCGSSREHAVWSLMDFGIKVVIAPSFADIFHSNSLKNGLLPITLAADVVDRLFSKVHSDAGLSLHVDLEALQLTPHIPGNDAGRATSEPFSFALEKSMQNRLLQGLDDIAMTLTYADDIRRYEEKRQQQAPWIFHARGLHHAPEK